MKKQNKIYLGIGIVAIILIAVIVMFSAPKGEETIKIGGLFALTGKWAVGGVTEANFAQIAIDEINQNGGIDGKPIQLILEDDKCSGNDAVTGANKLISQDKIKIILGPSCTPAAGPVAPIADTNKVFMLAATVTANGIFDDYDYAFRTSPPATDAARIIGEVAINKYNLKNVALVSEQTDFAKSWTDEFAIKFQELGGKVILSEEYPTGTTDFKTIISKINAADVDSVFVSGQAPQDAALIIKQMKELGLLDKVQIIGNPTTIDIPVYTDSGSSLPSDAFTIIPSVENKELLQKYLDKYNEEPGFQFFYTASMYDAVYMLKDAIENCGDQDGECVKNYFLNSINNWEGDVATWSFKSNGDPLIQGVYKELNIVNGEKVFKDVQE